MFGLIRLTVIGFVALTLVYISVSLYSRSVRRERLENHWAERHSDGGTDEDRAEFVHRGLRRYDKSMRRRLILLVYVIPVIVVATIVYVMNFK